MREQAGFALTDAARRGAPEALLAGVPVLVLAGLLVTEARLRPLAALDQAALVAASLASYFVARYLGGKRAVCPQQPPPGRDRPSSPARERGLCTYAGRAMPPSPRGSDAPRGVPSAPIWMTWTREK